MSDDDEGGIVQCPKSVDRLAGKTDAFYAGPTAAMWYKLAEEEGVAPEDVRLTRKALTMLTAAAVEIKSKMLGTVYEMLQHKKDVSTRESTGVHMAPGAKTTNKIKRPMLDHALMRLLKNSDPQLKENVQAAIKKKEKEWEGAYFPWWNEIPEENKTPEMVRRHNLRLKRYINAHGVNPMEPIPESNEKSAGEDSLSDMSNLSEEPIHRPPVLFDPTKSESEMSSMSDEPIKPKAVLFDPNESESEMSSMSA